jgi:LacI family transcriptional regulator
MRRIKQSRPTIVDVAKLAGVSLGTASQALNQKGGVAKETVAKVLEAAKQLNYYPSFAARHIQGQTSNILTLHLSIPPDGNIQHSTWNFYSLVIQGFMHTAKEHNFRMHLEMSSLEELLDNAYLEALAAGYYIHGTAFIVPYIGEYPGIVKLAERGYRIVTLYAKISEAIPSVQTNNFEAAKTVVEWLQELGHAKIGFINGEEKHFASFQRKDGYLEGMQGNDYQNIYNGDWTTESGVAGFRHFIAQKNLPTAIFCANDHMAMGVMKACRDLKITIPDDLSLVGFDDNFICEGINPQLTTVRMPLYHMGEEAARILLEKEDNAETIHKVLPSQLIIRNSAIPFKRIHPFYLSS